MDAQLEYSRLLHDSGHGIALRKPVQDIDVGDLCYWSPEGKAVRILNVFDNRQVCPYLAHQRINNVVAYPGKLAPAQHFKG